MVSKYQYVADCRKRTKARLVKIFGGKCRVCGYSKHPGGLDFHHANPKTKLFTIGNEIGRRNWEEIITETKKCVLVCRNCHSEIECGITKCPKIILPTEETMKPDILMKCYHCGKEFNVTAKSKKLYCSVECGMQSKQKIDWSSVDWTLTRAQIAKQYNLSWTAVNKMKRKRCDVV